MFFWRRKNKPYSIILESFHANKLEDIYHYPQYVKEKEKPYSINTTFRDIPVVSSDGTLRAKLRYIGIPDTVIYFTLKIRDIKEEYLSTSSTIDIYVKATISSKACKEYKFELLPNFNKGGVLACV